MHKIIIFLLLVLTVNFGYSQISTKRIDSLITVAKEINDVDSSSMILNIINKESKAIGYKLGMANYILIEGTNFYNKGKFDEALKFTYDGEKIVLSTNDNAKISHLYALRGNCFNNLFFFDKSWECLMLSKKYADKIKDDNARYFCLGRIYAIMAANFGANKKIKNNDSILYYLKKSYEIRGRIKGKGASQAGAIIQSASIGEIFLDMRKMDSAAYYFKISVAQAKRNNLQKYAVEALKGLGDVSFKQNKLDSALNYYLMALPHAIKKDNPNKLKLLYQSLATTYELLSNHQKSLEFYKKYALIADSIAVANKDAVTVPSDFIIKERELLAKKENQFNNLYLTFAISIAVLSLFIVIILYNNISASRKNNKALNNINKQMVAQNEYLHNTLEALEESNEKNNRVMQIITHDLRSPMAAIVGLSDFMISEHDLSEEDLEVVKLINTSGQDSLKFINEILEKESDAATLKKELVDLEQLLNYCIAQSQYRAKDKQQVITFKGEPATIALSREKIWRVISNLINNAIKFSPNQTTIAVTLAIKDKNAIIAVKDSGIGIPDDLKDKIFNSSDESKREGTSGEKSFGLGLAISKQIVEEHGGDLSFESKVGEGTTFFITLPV